MSPSDAKNYILGYTVGNDLSCRQFQLPGNSGGQFFFAKAFDKFAPIGPTLISPELFNLSSSSLTTKVNGEVRQTADFSKDLIFSPERILSHMSQGETCRNRRIQGSQCSRGAYHRLGTTIPAGTAVMTGTASGVGAFMKPKSFLRDGDIVEVEMTTVGTLTNKIRFK